MKISISPKKRVDFDGVVITFRPKTDSEAWAWREQDLLEMELPFDGKDEMSVNLNSNITKYVYNNPTFTIDVVDIKGYVKE